MSDVRPPVPEPSGIDRRFHRLATILSWVVLAIAVLSGLIWRARQYSAQFSFSVDELAIRVFEMGQIA